ncbi:hypothetical protein LCGC14_1968300 [marine sediment metagenome]|uniref:Uncharacterized protein n=1 Tax=marine sediment metagenome TaxID=412755 RepID=A0A0F9HQY8_9ZZZZ
MPCALCELKIRTPLYHEDGVCVVVDCIDCHVPMIVLKRHARTPTPTEEEHMMRVVGQLGFTITRKRPRKIRDHAHWHLEPK